MPSMMLQHIKGTHGIASLIVTGTVLRYIIAHTIYVIPDLQSSGSVVPHLQRSEDVRA